MAKPKDISELPGDMRRISRTFGPAMEATFRETIRRSTPKFNAAARAAAGPDRMLSRLGRKAIITAKFRIVPGHTQTLLYLSASGPWGLRDNSGVGGKTEPHVIRPKKAKALKFSIDGETVYAKSVNHPGSKRSAYWNQGVQEALAVTQRRVEPEVRRAIVAALSGRIYSTRGPFVG